MALVKKLQNGAVIENSFDEELDRQVGKFKLRSKDERRVRNALVEMKNYLGDKNATGRSFSTDIVGKTYSISGEGSEKFAGSPDDISKGWLSGRLKIKDDQDAMSVAAAIYNEALLARKKPENSTQINQPIEKQKRSILDLPEFAISRKAYGNEDNYRSELSLQDTEEKRRSFLINLSKKAVDAYLSEYDTEKDKFDYSDYGEVLKMKEILNTPNFDFNKYKEQAYKLDWTPGQFDLSEKDKEKQEQLKQQESQNNFKKLLDTKGISNIDMQNQLVADNFSEIVDNYSFTDDNKLNSAIIDRIRRDKGIIVKNPKTGKALIINKNGVLTQLTGENEFDPLFGYIINQNQNGSGIEIITPDKLYGQVEDTNLSNDVGKALDTNLEGQVYGFSTDFAGEENYQKNILGQRSYTKRLEWVKPDGNIVTLRKNESGQYVDDSGNVVNIQINNFKKGLEDQPYYDYESIYSHIPTSELKTKDFLIEMSKKSNFLKSIIKPGWQGTANLAGSILSAITKQPLEHGKFSTYQDSIKYLEEYLRKNPREINDETIEVAGYLKNQLISNPNISKNINLLNKVRNILAAVESRKINSNKKGGILKAQYGTSFSELVKNQGKETDPKSKKYKDTSKTWKGQSTEDNILDTVSIAGDIASFVPGVGAIGATTSFGATLLKDLKDGKIDEGKAHLLNAGFIALSLIGLGGAKALIKGANAAQKTVNLAKVGKFSKSYEVTKEVKEFNNFLKLADKKGLKTADDIATFLSKETNPTTKAIFEKGLSNVGKVAKKMEAKTPGKLAKFSDKLSDLSSSKVGKVVTTGARASMIGAGLNSAGNIINTTAAEGIEYTNPEDFRNLAMGISVGKTWLKDRNIVKAINKEKLPSDITSSAKKTVTIGDQTIDLDPSIGGKTKSTTFGLNKKASLENEESLTNLRNKIKESAKTQNKQIDENLLKNITYKDLVNVPEGRSTGLYLSDKPQNNKYSYELAKKTLNKYNIDWRKPEPPMPKPKPSVKPVSKKTKKSTPKQKIKKAQGGGTMPKNNIEKLAIKSKNWLNIDKTDVANIFMAANTLSANQKAASAQKRAALAGIVNIPYAPKQYIPTSSPMSIYSEKQAGNLRSQARNIASSTSDINKALSVQLAGEAQAADIIGKGQLSDLQASEKIKAMQREADAKTTAYNLEIQARNQASIANAIKSLNLVDANKEIAQNTAKNNLLLGLEKNLRTKENKQKLEKLLSAQNDPTYKDTIKKFTELTSADELKKRKEAFEKTLPQLSASKGELPTWEKSKNYADYKTEIENLKNILQSRRDLIDTLSADIQYSTLYKSGGSLSKQDRIDLEREKASLRNAQRDKELTYKSILQNNELLMKSLIKIFK